MSEFSLLILGENDRELAVSWHIIRTCPCCDNMPRSGRYGQIKYVSVFKKPSTKESEKDGKLVLKADSVFLSATDFSPAIKPSSATEPRVFELRTYTASPGNLDNLLTRFRGHTLKLFEKHAMTSFGYWTPTEKKNGAGEKLI